MPGTETSVFEPGAVASVSGTDASTAQAAAGFATAAAPATDSLARSGATEPVHHQAALRALRNLEATEARLQRAAERDAEQARGKLIQDLLPVLDNLDRTIAAHTPPPGPAPAGSLYGHGATVRGEPHPDQAMLDGVRMIRQQLEGVLRGYGATRIDAIDQPFDPSRHEAIGVVPVEDPGRHGVVVDQAEPGYELAGKLLRPARVTVGKFVAPTAIHRPHWRFERGV
jgi:molecular chaperone GrpE